MRPPPLLRSLLSLIAYLAVALLATLPVWQAPVQRIVGGGADAHASMWFLEWTPFALSHVTNPFISDYLNYPTGFNLLWNTSVPAISLIVWPVTAIWGVVAAYNTAMVGGIALSAWLGRVAIRRYVDQEIPSLVGGLIYGFSPYVTAHALVHLNVTLSAITPPLALLLLDQLALRQKRRPVVLGIAIAGVAILQYFIFQEVLLTEVIIGALVLAVLALSRPPLIRQRWRYVSKTLATAAAVFILLMAYPLFIQVFGPNHFDGSIPQQPPDAYATDVLNFVVPTNLQLIAPHSAISLTSKFSGNEYEWTGYVGIPLLLTIAVYAVLRRRERGIRVTAIITVIIGILSLGAHLHIGGQVQHIPLPWWLAEHLPFLVSVVPGRLTIYVFFGAGLLVAFVLRELLTTVRYRVAAPVVAAAILAPLLPQVPLAWESIRIPGYFTGSAVQSLPAAYVAVTGPYAVTAYGPFDSPDDTIAMVWQAASAMRFRNIGGDVHVPIPAQVTRLQTLVDAVEAGRNPALSTDDRSAVGAELRQYHVEVVLVGPCRNERGVLRLFATLFGTNPPAVDGIRAWRVAGDGTG